MKTYNTNLKAELFQQLATMESAGIPIIQAVNNLLPHKYRPFNQSLIVFTNNLKLGKSIASAGSSSGIFSETDSLLVNAASESGKLQQTFQRLAKYYGLKTRLKQQLKSRMLFPVTVFTLSVFIAPLASLVTGAITTAEYLSLTVLFLLKCCLVVYLLFMLPNYLRHGFLQKLGRANTIDNLQLKIPVFGKYLIKHQITGFIETLGMLLEAGIPAFEALPKAVENIPNDKLRNSFNPVINHLLSHGTMTDALAMNPYINSQAIMLIKSGEASGRLYESINHYAQLARAELTAAFEEFATWLPRILYGIVCLYMAHAILSSGAFLPSVDV